MSFLISWFELDPSSDDRQAAPRAQTVLLRGGCDGEVAQDPAWTH